MLHLPIAGASNGGHTTLDPYGSPLDPVVSAVQSYAGMLLKGWKSHDFVNPSLSAGNLPKEGGKDKRTRRGPKPREHTEHRAARRAESNRKAQQAFRQRQLLSVFSSPGSESFQTPSSGIYSSWNGDPNSWSQLRLQLQLLFSVGKPARHLFAIFTQRTGECEILSLILVTLQAMSLKLLSPSTYSKC